MTVIEMPKLSDSMQDGMIVAWLKGQDEAVEVGDDLLEIETDKATMVHVAEEAGALKILVPEGETVPVGTPIAELGDANATPTPAAEPTPVEESPSAAATDRPDLPAAPAPALAAQNGHSEDAGTRATPLAKRVAAAHGIAISEIVGTGPLGRITRADVLAKAGIEPEPRAAAPLPATAGPAPGPAAVVSAQTPATAAGGGAQPPVEASGKGAVTVTELTRLQAVVSRRMAESKATVPHFQVQTEVQMDAAVAFRSQIRGLTESSVSYNDLIVKAAALALRRYPLANGSFRDGHFELYSRVNVGVAVAAEGALVVPTIYDADQKSLGAIAADTSLLAGRVRDGSITPPELASATFTVSNLGMYGMTAIFPVVNPPQAAILGVGAMRATLARQDGEIVEHQLMTLTLSCDHRILYGAEAAQFLSAIRELLEQPFSLAL